MIFRTKWVLYNTVVVTQIGKDTSHTITKKDQNGAIDSLIQLHHLWHRPAHTTTSSVAARKYIPYTAVEESSVLGHPYERYRDKHLL